MKGKLITISGIDGSGKSTISHELVDMLQNNGYSACYHYGRYDYNLALPIMVMGDKIVRDSNTGETYDDYSDEKRSFLDKPLMSQIYEFISIIDYIPFMVSKLELKLRQNEYVVCDRYIYDTILKNFGGKIIDNGEQAANRMQVYSKVTHAPSHRYLLQIPVDIALARKDDIRSESLIKEQKELYESFASFVSMTELDGTEPVDDICNMIYTEVTDE